VTCWPGKTAPNTWPGSSGVSAASLSPTSQSVTFGPNAISRQSHSVTTGTGAIYNGVVNVSWNRQ
jgi:hypothetical protein